MDDVPFPIAERFGILEDPSLLDIIVITLLRRDLRRRQLGGD